jgi:hypothetical protein
MNNQKTIKARDPNWRDMEALRKSGAAGSHRDKKKEQKLGKVKHKGKEMDESIYSNEKQGAELSRIGRILMDKAVTTKDDALSNVLSRVGSELTRYGAPGGPTSMQELEKKTKLPQEKILKLMKWAQGQEDTSLQKVKDPDPKPDDEDEKEESVATENTPIGHTDDERNMIRKELYQMATYAKEMFQMLEDLPADSDFPHWWQAKVVKSLSMISKAKHYLENEINVPDVGGDRTEEGVEEGEILDKLKKDIKQGWGATKAQFKDPFNMNAAKDYLDKEDAKELKTDLQDAGYDEKQIKMAYGILNDPRYKQGNMTGALKAIEKVAPGMSEEPAIQNAIKATQENIDTDEAVKENINLTDKELADAVFKAIDLADELDVNYAVDKVAEFAEDLYSAVNGTNEAVCSECGKARFVAMPEHVQQQYESVNEEKQKGVDGKVCWKGYKRMGTKKKGGKTVDNCVKM